MTRQDLETEALRLEPGDRLRLTHLLVSSLGDLSGEQIAKLWLEEAERRDAELSSGAVEAVPGPEVFEQIRRHHS
jgi:hypothetical protein